MSLRALGFFFLVAGIAATASPSAAADIYDLGDRRELFVDRHQVESLAGSARLELHSPTPAEVAIKFDSPIDGPTSAYVTVFQDGDIVRMYYRGSGDVGPDKKMLHQHACYAESRDGGRTFVKPKLGLVEINGSKENNVVLEGTAHNFTPFKDTRPGVPADERYKAVMTSGKGLAAFYSADGIRWRRAFEQAVITKGAFDSQNLAYWDANHKQYRSYYRVFTNKVRDIALATSDDFEHWTDPELMKQSGTEPQEQFYTNAITPYFRAPHIYFCFPKRFVPSRVGLEGFKGISDAKFLSSRDGIHFDRTFMEAFIRPGRDENNWGDRGTMTAWGIVQTGPDEMSVYYSQHYRHKTAHMRRGVLRLDGIASLHADGTPGELVTKPFTFTGKTLTLNYATSAVGSVQVEIQTDKGEAIPGFTLKDAPQAFGDKIETVFAWNSGSDISALAGKPVRLRFVVRDADVYSYRFTGEAAAGE
jgi:hypothetical protein